MPKQPSTARPPQRIVSQLEKLEHDLASNKSVFNTVRGMCRQLKLWRANNSNAPDVIATVV
jgi:hypothetical protein